MLKDGRIKCNCPGCLEPEVLELTSWPRGYWTIRCRRCGFVVSVPGQSPTAQEVALECVGANELGEKQESDRRLIVHEGEAQDVIPADERKL